MLHRDGIVSKPMNPFFSTLHRSATHLDKRLSDAKELHGGGAAYTVDCFQQLPPNMPQHGTCAHALNVRIRASINRASHRSNDIACRQDPHFKAKHYKRRVLQVKFPRRCRSVSCSIALFFSFLLMSIDNYKLLCYVLGFYPIFIVLYCVSNYRSTALSCVEWVRYFMSIPPISHVR